MRSHDRLFEGLHDIQGAIEIPRVSVLALAMLVGIAMVAGPIVAAEQPESSKVVSPERRPYDVQLLVAFDATQFDATAKRTLFREVHQTARRCVGDMWSLKSSEISWLSSVTERGLVRLDRSTLEKHHAGETADLWLVAVVEARQVGLRVSVRSWQPEVQSETSVVSVDVLDQRDVAVTVLQLCRELVRPMGIVEQVNDRSVRIRLRAGELIPPDPSFAQLAPGDLLMPILAYRNKDKAIEKLQTIPWTYISVDEVHESSITGTVQSGLRLALGGKKRGRIDTLVVALRPQFASTRLELLTQTKPMLPLVAHRLEVRTEPVIPRATESHPDIDPASTLLREMLTDRRGLTKVSVEPDHSLVWIFAYSGQHLLARVPFVPGIVAEVRLEVPDDATRLATEADLQMLQGEVIDAVALRNTAMSAIRAALKKDDFDAIDRKLELLKQQQSSSTLVERLIAVRVAGTTAAKARKDKAAEARINRMCDETTSLVRAHLGEEKIRLLIEEVDALRTREGTATERK